MKRFLLGLFLVLAVAAASDTTPITPGGFIALLCGAVLLLSAARDLKETL